MNKKAFVLFAVLALFAAEAVFADPHLVLGGILYRSNGSVEVTRVARYIEVYRGDEYPDEEALAAVVAETDRRLKENVPEYSPEVSWFVKERSGGKPTEAFIVIKLEARTGIDQILPTDPRGHSVTSGLGDTPTLAGSPSPVLGPRSLLDGRVLSNGGVSPLVDRTVFGGYDDGDIFGGFRLMAGASFMDADGVGFFVRGNVHAEYDRSGGSGEMIDAWATTFGFFGGDLLPWAFASTLVCEDQNGRNPYGSSVAGTVFPLAKLGPLGELKGACDIGVRYGVAGSSDETPEAFLRAALSTDGRSFLGPLSQGIAARVVAEGGVDVQNAEPYGVGSFVLEASYRLRSMAGVSVRAGALWSTEDYDEWTDDLRILEDGSVTGDMGLLASVEFPVLFARGVLLHSKDLSVDFFLQPFLDFVLVRPDYSSPLFSSDNIHASAGGELSMTLDRFRRSVLRVFAGSDVTNLMNGSSAYSLDLAFGATLSVEW